MNVLTFVGFFLLLFAFFASSFWNDWEISKDIKMSHSGYFQATREAQSLVEEKLYKDVKEHREKKGGSQTPNPQNPFPRKPHPKTEEEEEEMFTICPCGSLNIEPLFQNIDKERYEMLAKLLRRLYGSILPSFGERAEYRLIDAIIAEGKKVLKKEQLDLTTLELKDERLQLLLYRMLQGTKFYDPQNKEGVPPLLNYVRLSKDTNNICLVKAPYELLELLFNEKTANEIVKLRKGKSEIKSADCNEWLPNRKLFWISHSKHIKLWNEKVLGQDSASAIQVEKTCHSSSE